MARERIQLMVEIDLDPVPGSFHTPQSAAVITEAVIASRLGHYNPTVFVVEDLPEGIEEKS